MYSSLAAAKAAVISVGEEIASQLGLPAGICPLVLYLLAQEMFLLEHERYLNFFLTVLWIRTSFQSYLKWLISGVRMYLNQQGHQIGCFKFIDVLSLAKTWFKTRIQQSHLIKYILHYRILFLGYPC
ncbi:uncharacterized protein LOC115716964 [Cannabis sativa]|nr:uncharacterized protein LOC115716964 [Cannabis sativa]